MRKNAHASSAMEKGFISQLTSNVTSSPVGRRPRFLRKEKSTFIIMGVIMSQIRTAMGTLNWLPFANSKLRSRR
jgi:hypothetical protein